MNAKLWLSCAICFMAGWTDAITVLARFGCFGTMMTGNTFLFGASFYLEAERLDLSTIGIPTPAFLFIVMCTFFVGVVIHASLGSQCGVSTRWFAFIALLSWTAHWALAQYVPDHHRLLVLPLSLLHGVLHSVAVKRGFGKVPEVLTGSFVALGHNAVEALHGRDKVSSTDQAQARMGLTNLAAVLLGACCAVVADKYLAPAVGIDLDGSDVLGLYPVYLFACVRLYLNDQLLMRDLEPSPQGSVAKPSPQKGDVESQNGESSRS